MAIIDTRDTVPIPQPKGYPLVGNISNVDIDHPTASLLNLTRKYGEIYSLTIFGKRTIMLNTVALLNEVCDEKRFTKAVDDGLLELRAGVHDGLFTAHTGEKNWTIAHRVLVPAFGPLNMKDMFDDMKDICSQLVLKWARMGPDYCVPVTDDFTRLTLDTIALCAMGYRFNSFYKDELHPFIHAMLAFLKIGADKPMRPKIMSPFYHAEERKFEKSIAYLRSFSADLVKQRREHPTDAKDLMAAMINGKDPKTGESLPESSIIDNMITFLVAGHETTSGMLSLLWYYMLKSPEAYRKAQEEVDRVIGTRSIQYEDLNKLPYINAMLRETLRLQPTAPGFGVTPIAEGGELIGGKYHVKKGESMFGILHSVHRDPAVYGADAEEWKPERMLDEEFEKLPPGAWKPFGNGARGCIGRPFAWQEAQLVVATLLQYLNFHMDNPSYELQLKEALTIKPQDFNIRTSLREGWTSLKIERHLAGSIRGGQADQHTSEKAATVSDHAIPFTVLYGSNSGTCEAFAQTLANDAASHGFKASKVVTLDSYARQKDLPSEPIVIVTASYEGEPTDDAAHWHDWLAKLPEDKKLTTSHAVFGAGHSDWKTTFHRVPTFIDDKLSAHGSTRICERGGADAAKGDMMSEFQAWEDQVLWPAMKEKYGGDETDLEAEAAFGAQNLTVEVSSRRASHLRADVSEAKVVAARTLTAPGVPEKKHIEIQLPTAMTYRAGDYLAVLPLNPVETVHRVVTRFNLPWDCMLKISSKTGTAAMLPTDHPISAQTLFSAYLELSQPATKRNIAMLASVASDKETKAALESLASDENFANEITAKRVSLLDLLERFPDLPLPLSAFIASLITMRVRQYSVSSSPLYNPNVVSLTYAVLDSPSMSGQGRYIGVATNYLAHLAPGDIVHVAVKPSHQAFHLPTKAESVPIIMVAAGTGIAPFRGFIQERAAQIGAGRKLAPAHLYVGYRRPDKDELYRDEMERFEQQGAVQIHHAYSQAPELSNGHKHVDDVLNADAELLGQLWEDGARVYVCGSRGVGDAVKRIAIDQHRQTTRERGEDDSEEAANKWFEKIRNERFSTDVFD
jgi:cytochrome P450/NADPH-cytochrome P450 reductase